MWMGVCVHGHGALDAKGVMEEGGLCSTKQQYRKDLAVQT